MIILKRKGKVHNEKDKKNTMDVIRCYGSRGVEQFLCQTSIGGTDG